jgi:hypothetical protein
MKLGVEAVSFYFLIIFPIIAFALGNFLKMSTVSWRFLSPFFSRS